MAIFDKTPTRHSFGLVNLYDEVVKDRTVQTVGAISIVSKKAQVTKMVLLGNTCESASRNTNNFNTITTNDGVERMHPRTIIK